MIYHLHIKYWLEKPYKDFFYTLHINPCHVCNTCALLMCSYSGSHCNKVTKCIRLYFA